jgi:hypothetical protein
VTLKTQAIGNIEMDLKEMVWVSGGWNRDHHQSLWNTVINQRFCKSQGIRLNDF